MMKRNTQFLMSSVLSLILFGMPHGVESFQAVTMDSGRRMDAMTTNDQRTSLIAGIAAPFREPTIIEEELLDDEEDDFDELVDGLTQKLEAMEGLWYSDDFYGAHGREWVQISARLVGASARTAMVAIKVTGDPHVPSGCVTWQTEAWPSQGGPGVSARIQVRANPNDPDGFSWLPGEVTLINHKQIQLVCQHTPTMKNMGTFHKKENDEEGAFE